MPLPTKESQTIEFKESISLWKEVVESRKIDKTLKQKKRLVLH